MHTLSLLYQDDLLNFCKASMVFMEYGQNNFQLLYL